MENEKSVSNDQMSVIQLAILTGFTAGVGGTLFGYFAYSFHFTKINPAIVLAPFQGEWKTNILGGVVAAVLYGLLSIIAALLYYFMLKKKASLIWGIIFGVGIFIVIFYVMPPILPDIKPLVKYDLNTILTELCFFITYGLFIGYSISYEYNEQLYWKKHHVQQ